jgi:ATP synthase, F1 delta subunit
MNELYNRYALALLEIAKEEKKVEDYRDEVASLRLVFKGNPEFVHFLANFNFELDEKYSFIDKNLSKTYDDELIAYIKIIVRNGRANLLYKIFNETLMRFDDFLGIERGTIYSTYPLDSKDLYRIKDVIEKNTSKRIELNNIIDKDLIGGIKIVLKNDIYDASILSKVNGLKKALLKGGND